MVTFPLVLRAAFFSRLALALLALLGFSAPLAERQVDEVVQTAHWRPQRAAPAPLPPAAPPALAARSPEPPQPSVEPPATARRRYLEHRAWLI